MYYFLKKTFHSLGRRQCDNDNNLNLNMNILIPLKMLKNDSKKTSRLDKNLREKDGSVLKMSEHNQKFIEARISNCKTANRPQH